MIAFRPASSDSDRRFIISGWSSSYRTANAAGFITMGDWANVMHRQIDLVLDRPEVLAVIAHGDEDPDQFYGFVVAEPDSRPPLVFYCFVKAPYRKLGIARGLFGAVHIDPARQFNFACRTSVVSELEQKIPFAKFRPVSARYPRNERWSP